MLPPEAINHHICKYIVPRRLSNCQVVSTGERSNKELADLYCQPVGISRGILRFRVPYRFRLMRELAPSRKTFGLGNQREFELSYIEGLEKIELDSIIAKLVRIGQEAGRLPLKLTKPGGSPVQTNPYFYLPTFPEAASR